jgi:hypothetical protein
MMRGIDSPAMSGTLGSQGARDSSGHASRTKGYADAQAREPFGITMEV